MKRLALVSGAVLFFVTVSHATAGDELSIAASKIESAISNRLKSMGQEMKISARELGKLGAGSESAIRKLLSGLLVHRPFVVDAAFVDAAGIMKVVEPEQYRKFEGTDISKQQAVIQVKKSRKPRLGDVFDSVEGIRSVDVEYPVFSKDKEFLGSISLLLRHDELIRAVAVPMEKDLGVQCWVMQKDGHIMYETDPGQIGLNLFHSPQYKDYPNLISLGKKMVKEEQGKGFYSFLAHRTGKVIQKEAAWRTIGFFNNQWTVVAYRGTK